MKTCIKCGVEKSIDQFYLNAGKRRTDCIPCNKAKVARWTDENRAHVYARNSEYRKTWYPANKVKVAAKNRALYLADPFKSWFKSARATKLKTGHVFDMVWSEVEAVLIRQEFSCALTGIKFWGSGRPDRKGFKWDSPSFDRLQPGGPYTLSNTRLILMSVNCFRGEMPDEQMYAVAAALLHNREPVEVLAA